MSLKSALRRFYLVHFLKNLASAVPAGFMFLFILERGFNLQDIGIIFTTFALTVIILEVPTGGLADAIGRKKTAIYSYLLNIVAILLLYVSTNMMIALAYAVAAGLGQTLGSGSLDAWFIDQIKKDNPDTDLQPYLARADVYETLSSTIGALLGGVAPLIAYYFYPDIELLAVPLLLSIVLRGFSLYALIRLIPGDNPNPEAQLQPLKALRFILQDASKTVAHSSQLQRLLLANFANGLALGSFDAFWQPYFKTAVGIASSNTLAYGVLQAAGFLCATVGSLIATWFVSRSGGHGRAAFITQVVKAVLFVVLAMTNNIFISSLAFSFFYITLMMNLSPHGTLYNHNLPNNRRSSLMSINSLTLFLGSGVGLFVIGWIANQFGFASAFISIAAITFLSAFCYWGMRISKSTETPADKA